MVGTVYMYACLCLCVCSGLARYLCWWFLTLSVHAWCMMHELLHVQVKCWTREVELLLFWAPWRKLHHIECVWRPPEADMWPRIIRKRQASSFNFTHNNQIINSIWTPFVTLLSSISFNSFVCSLRSICDYSFSSFISNTFFITTLSQIKHVELAHARPKHSLQAPSIIMNYVFIMLTTLKRYTQ